MENIRTKITEVLDTVQEDWRKLREAVDALAEVPERLKRLEANVADLEERLGQLEESTEEPPPVAPRPEPKKDRGLPQALGDVPPGWPTKPRNFHPFFHGPIASKPEDWKRYGQFLGTESGIFATWANPKKATWEDVAGGPGRDPARRGGQLGGKWIAGFFDPTMWDIRRDPSVMTLFPVPREVGNFGKGGKWQNPGVWEEIASGRHDSVYERLFGRLAWHDRKAGADPQLRVYDIGHEATGNWYPHSIGPEVEAYRHAMVRIASIMYDRYEAITGKRPLWLWRPSPVIRFGDRKGRVMDACPIIGERRPDMVGLSLHVFTPIRSRKDVDAYLHYPGPATGGRHEGWLDFVEQARAKGFRWIVFPETGMNNPLKADEHFPVTENPRAYLEGLRDFLLRVRPLAMMYMDQGRHRVSTPRVRDWAEPFVEIFGDPSQWKAG